MTRIVQFQTNFSVGELDPLLRARTDLEQYQNALETAKNVTVQPQGGVSRRDGLKFIYDFGSSFTSFKMIPFEYSVDDSYMLIFVNLRMYVFKNGVLQTNINSSGNDYATTTITAAMLDELNYTQAVDTLIVCQEDLAPQRILRNSDTSWTVETLPIDYTPQFAFDFFTLPCTFGITPSDTGGNTELTATTFTHETGTAQGGSTSTIIHKNGGSYTYDDQPQGLYVTILSGTGSGQSRIITSYVNSTKTSTVYPDWTTAPDATSQYKVYPFAADLVGNYYTVLNGFGRAKITEFVSDTVVKVAVDVPFFDTDEITAQQFEVELGWEDTWSSSVGWPRSVAFHEGRLYFGGSKSRPNTIWGSRVSNFYNFNPGSGLDDEAVEATLNTNQFNAITHVHSSSELQIFTTGGEFVVTQTSNNPITPGTFLIKPQTKLGSKPGVPLEDLNGATIFIQRQGKSIISFQFRDTVAAFNSTALSVLSSHLVRQPVDLAVRRSTSTDETDRLFLVNGDGTMAVYSILEAQNVIAPSEYTTDGDFIACAVEIDKAYAIVKRTVNSTDNYFLELFSEDHTTDSAKSGGAAASVTMDHLQGKEVSIIRDGLVEASQTVPASPYTITFATAASTSYEVGIDFDVEVKTMPAEPRLRQGTVQGIKKRILQIDAIVHESQNLVINGQNISFTNFGEDVLDTAITPYTGLKTVSGLLGFTDTGQITITQSEPQSMTLLGLEYRMSVGN